MPYDFAAAQKRAHNQIERFGGAGVLIRAGVERACTMAVLDYKPREAELRMDGARRVLISAYQLATPPDYNLDMLRYTETGELFRLVTPVAAIKPKDIVIFFDCEVVYDSRTV